MFKWVRKLVAVFIGSSDSKPAEVELTFTAPLVVEEPKPLEPITPVILSAPSQDDTDTIVDGARNKPEYGHLRASLISDVREMYTPWQEHTVPMHICQAMVEPLPIDAHYWVLFAPEFVEALIHTKHINPENIAFFGDDKMLVNIVRDLYGVKRGGTIPRDLSTLPAFLTRRMNEMQFNKLVVVGNPPYQQETAGMENGRQATPLYNIFIDTILAMDPKPDYFTFIVPSRWMVGGMGLEEFRTRMLNDRHMKSITHFPGDREIFKTVSIPGGVNYFLWRKNYSGTCSFTVDGKTVERVLNQRDIVLLDINADSILEKIQRTTNDWMSDSVFPINPFGLRTEFSLWNETNTGVPCYSRGGSLRYCDRSLVDFNKNSVLEGTWKVCVGEANGAAQKEDAKGAKNVLTNVLLLDNETVCTGTYIVVNAFDTEEEALFFISYLKTKFFRFMLGLRVLTQHINKDKFSWVPDLGDYTKTWTDTELYDMFSLSADERAYVEAKIKPLE